MNSPRFPLGQIGYAVGDIHGRSDLLLQLFTLLESDLRSAKVSPVVVFLGDYVDRGPDSAHVIELLRTWRPKGFECRFLKGNHEAAMLAFMEDPIANKSWLAHGGLQTLASYRVNPLPSLGATNREIKRAAAALNAALPDPHRAFLHGLERYVVVGDYAFVHAGVDPLRSLDEQRDEDLLWIRNRFLDSESTFEKIVVHGHTPSALPHHDQRRVGIDTGAYYSGKLTAARFEDEKVSFMVVPGIQRPPHAP